MLKLPADQTLLTSKFFDTMRLCVLNCFELPSFFQRAIKRSLGSEKILTELKQDQFLNALAMYKIYIGEFNNQQISKNVQNYASSVFSGQKLLEDIRTITDDNNLHWQIRGLKMVLKMQKGDQLYVSKETLQEITG